jgi:multidrug transporter EmrE-like cation transporter
MSYYILFFYLLAAISAALPIPLIKKYTQGNPRHTWLVLALFSYIILIYSYIIILQDKNITIVYPIVKVISILVVLLFVIFAFGNKISWEVGVGILFGLLSIYLLSKNV